MRNMRADVKANAGAIRWALLGPFALTAAPLEPQSYSAVLHFTDPIVIILTSVVLSVPLLVWLAALLGIAQGDIHAR